MEVISIPGFSEPISCWSHLLAAFAALVGLFFLYRKGRGNRLRLFALLVFTFSLIFLFSMSGVYHLLEPGGVPRSVMQRLDHAGIWVLIAGSFTPIHIILFRGSWRWSILALVWTIAVTGLVLEVIFFTQFPEWLTLTLFLSLGWIGALSAFRFRRNFGHQSLQLLLGGGLLYSIGAIFDFTRWPIIWAGVLGPHELFHLFVVGGSALHWLFIYTWADHAVHNRLTFHVRIYPQELYLAHALGEAIEVEARTLEELKAEIRRRVQSKFHPRITPTVYLKYFKEELL